ncbi:hypothetical protein D3C75_714470 [compost metagenome]
MPQHRQALLALGTLQPLPIAFVEQHATQHPLAKPRVVADFLIQEVGQVTVADDQGIVQARMRAKALLQFAHGKMQE